MPTFSVDGDELEAMLGAHRDRRGVLRIGAASLATVLGAPLRPEDVQVDADRAESRVTMSWPDPRPLHTLTLTLEPEREA